MCGWGGGGGGGGSSLDLLLYYLACIPTKGRILCVWRLPCHNSYNDRTQKNIHYQQASSCLDEFVVFLVEVFMLIQGVRNRYLTLD